MMHAMGAPVAELVDAADSKSVISDVGVRVSPGAPGKNYFALFPTYHGTLIFFP